MKKMEILLAAVMVAGMVTEVNAMKPAQSGDGESGTPSTLEHCTDQIRTLDTDTPRQTKLGSTLERAHTGPLQPLCSPLARLSRLHSDEQAQNRIAFDQLRAEIGGLRQANAELERERQRLREQLRANESAPGRSSPPDTPPPELNETDNPVTAELRAQVRQLQDENRQLSRGLDERDLQIRQFEEENRRLSRGLDERDLQIRQLKENDVRCLQAAYTTVRRVYETLGTYETLDTAFQQAERELESIQKQINARLPTFDVDSEVQRLRDQLYETRYDRDELADSFRFFAAQSRERTGQFDQYIYDAQCELSELTRQNDELRGMIGDLRWQLHDAQVQRDEIVRLRQEIVRLLRLQSEGASTEPDPADHSDTGSEKEEEDRYEGPDATP
ncbi:MAG: hypothetical protein LBJ69_04090 [Holosporales bacterium]|jgi:chromosome segregation ATPase|nr:hypothetical protein [Holosporales bacterium]